MDSHVSFMEHNRHPSPFDELAERYDGWFDNEGKLIFEIEVRAFTTILNELPTPWLEVGVGSGRFAQALGIETGIDPSVQLLQIAKQRDIDARYGRGEDRIFPEDTFGAVFLIVTLCFLESPDEVLREIRRILRPDGVLILGLVLKESPWGRFYRAQKEEGHPFYSLARFFTYDELAGLLERSGFRIERTLSTLFQRPSEVVAEEEPRDGYWPDAGFTVVVAGRSDQR